LVTNWNNEGDGRGVVEWGEKGEKEGLDENMKEIKRLG